LTYGGITGVGFGLMWSTSIVAVGRYFTTKLPTATGIAVAGSGVGTLVFSSISAHLIPKIGWRATLQVFAAFTGVSNVAAALLFLPINPPPVHSTPPPAEVHERAPPPVEVHERATSVSIRLSAMDGGGKLDDEGLLERGVRQEQEGGGRGDVEEGQGMVACAPEKQKKVELAPPPVEVQERASSDSIRLSVMEGGGKLDDEGLVERGVGQEQEGGGRGDVEEGQGMVAGAPEKERKVERTVLTVWELLRHRTALPLGLFMLVYAGMLWVPYTFLVTYSRTVGGLSPAASGRLVAGMTWLRLAVMTCSFIPHAVPAFVGLYYEFNKSKDGWWQCWG